MVAVVIPLFNKADFVGRALTSVFRQTVADFELIVVDDGSTDGSGEVASSLKDSRLKLIHQENQGESAARNTGVAAAESELVAFLDADDAWDAGFLEKILSLQENFPQAGAYATAYRIVYPDGSTRVPNFQVFPAGLNEGLIDNYFRAASSFPVWSSAVAVRKSVLQKIGGFPVGEVNGGDLDTWLRIALKYPIAWTGDVLATWFNEPRERCWAGEPRLCQTAKRALAEGSVPPEKSRDLQEYAAGLQVAAAKSFLKQGQKAQALHLLAYARGTRTWSKQWWECRLLAALPRSATRNCWQGLRTIKHIFKKMPLL